MATIVLKAVDYFGTRFRRRRSQRIRDLIERTHRAHQDNGGGAVSIIDVGGRKLYWESTVGGDFLRSRGAKITIVNVEIDPAAPPKDDDVFTHVVGDGCDLSRYADRSFDIAHSNSVIEHVGGWAKMQAFVHETRRLAPSYYLQTPYFWFPVEPHFVAPFFHWLPEGDRARLLMQFRLGHFARAKDWGEAMSAVQSIALLNRAQLQFLLPDATIHFEWLGPLAKSMIAVRGLP
jgi:hypothetical protein